MILLLSNADTELLALRTILHRLPAGFPEVRAANPATRTDAPPIDGVDAVVIRLLGGRSAWEAPFDRLRAACVEAGVPFVAVGGEATPDPEMAARSTVTTGIATEAHRYLAAGGPDNVEQLLRFVADTVLFHGFGFDPPTPVPMTGRYEWRGRSATTAAAQSSGDAPDGRPKVGVVFYRAHLLAGNTQFVDDLCAGLDAAGVEPVPVYCYSLRPERADDGTSRVPALDLLRAEGVDALVTCVLAMGSTGSGGTAATLSPDEAWDAGELAALGVPVLQAPSCNRPRVEWADDEAGLTPLDVATGVAIPEFDGRIIGPAFSFKETVDDGGTLGTPVVASRTDPDRVRRVAGLAARLARLRHTPEAGKRVAIVLSAYPTKRSRLGNAVGLDTPASTIRLLHALRDAGYRVDGIPVDGDALMAALADRLTYETPELSPEEAALAVGSLPAASYEAWFAGLPEAARAPVEAVWGPPPGSVYLDPEGTSLVFPGLDLGNVLVTIQPPRGFGSDPIGTYHAPDIPPPHHYLAFYRWLDE
ncbi:MAG TPA: cobaltochelatase subunit CobN, partial [Acidimicrobiales bacterium]